MFDWNLIQNYLFISMEGVVKLWSCCLRMTRNAHKSSLPAATTHKTTNATDEKEPNQNQMLATQCNPIKHNSHGP
jgi:hypothetical protein